MPTKSKRYTIHDIKQANEAIGGRYFSRENLRHAGQTVKAFSVRHVAGRVFIFAARYVGHGDKPMRVGTTYGEFIPETGTVRSLVQEGVQDDRTFAEFMDRLLATK